MSLVTSPLPAQRAVPKPQKSERKRKTRKKKLSTRQRLERQLDRIVKEIVISRDTECVCPPPLKGHTDVLQPGHLITRSKESVKWDLFNVNAQCSGCNLRHEYSPEIYTSWFIGRFGEDRYLQLVKDSTPVQKLMIDDLERLVFTLTEIQKRQETDENFLPYYTQKELLKGELWK